MQNTTIRICSIEDKGTQIKIIDEHKQSWSFFKVKKDGQPTKAFQQFPSYKIGDTTGIGYSEAPNTKYGGVFRNIVNFTPTNYAQAQIPTQAPIAPPSSKYEATNDFKPRNYAKEGYSRCLWAKWLKDSDQIANTTLNWKDKVWEVFQEIEQDATKRFSEKQGWDKAVAIFGGQEVNADEPPLNSYSEIQ